MEGTPRLTERERGPFKPQTVLLRQMPSGGFESDFGEPETFLQQGSPWAARGCSN
jgi:hypothetical protein